MYQGDELYNEVFSFVQKLEIIDTHEHLPGFEKRRNPDADVLSEYLGDYIGTDLQSAGLPEKDFIRACDTSIPIMERYRLLEPYWEACRFTGYGRGVDETVRLVYGEDGINAATIERINDKFKASLAAGGQYRKVLKDISKIKVSILDCFDAEPGCDPDYFVRVYRFDPMIYLCQLTTIRQMEEETGFTIHSFDAYLEAVEAIFDKVYKNGTRVLKSALAYFRPLRYERALKCDAERAFNQIFEIRHLHKLKDFGFTVGMDFQNYMMHYVLSLADKYRMTYQFHTGFQASGANHVGNSNPALMTNFFTDYPNVHFDLFHISYPYQKEAGIIAKMFPNVTVDMCWAHIVSPAESVQTLCNWLDLIPYNKISGFGGDFCNIDCVAGHQYMARQNIARALSKKVGDGSFNLGTAQRIARAILYDNPKRIFQLDGLD